MDALLKAGTWLDAQEAMQKAASDGTAHMTDVFHAEDKWQARNLSSPYIQLSNAPAAWAAAMATLCMPGYGMKSIQCCCQKFGIYPGTNSQEAPTRSGLAL